MDAQKAGLCGSPARDKFKLMHKRLSATLYACDIDFVLVSKDPPDIVTVLDYKADGDSVTFSEVICYSGLVRRGIRVYIVQGDADSGQFTINLFCGGHHSKPRYELREVARTNSWSEFEQWERNERTNYEKRWAVKP